MNEKLKLRKYAKEIRKTFNLEELSISAVEKIKNEKCYLNSKNIMIYYPLREEINFLDLLNDKKNFYLPRVNRTELEPCKYSKGDTLVKSSLGVCEPVCPSSDVKDVEMIIVPALMIDENNYRLGYGGGYYDRFLAKNNIFSISIVPKELCIKNLPVETFDIPVNKVIVL